MKTTLSVISIFIIALTSCINEVDPGPLQLEEKQYAMLDFDRLDAGDDFVLEVVQGPVYKVHVQGDRRNLQDLEVTKLGTTLRVNFNGNGGRSHATFVKITMPSLTGASFYGASNFTIVGFKCNETELALSGASIGQMNVESEVISLSLSGASRLTISGMAAELAAKASGASELEAFGLSAMDVHAEAFGASRMNLFASNKLNAMASGASMIYYRGNPGVTAAVSGASTIQED